MVIISDTIHDFYKSNELGKEGERIVHQWLISRPNVKYIKDVSDDKTYQQKDIDFLIRFNDGSCTSIEIKTDGYITGNIFFETISNVSKHTKGCMYATEAEYLFYYFITYDELFILQMKQYRKWFNKHYQDGSIFHEKIIHNKFFNSIGYTFKRDLLRKQPFCKTYKGLKEVN